MRLLQIRSQRVVKVTTKVVKVVSIVAEISGENSLLVFLQCILNAVWHTVANFG